MVGSAQPNTGTVPGVRVFPESGDSPRCPASARKIKARERTVIDLETGLTGPDRQRCPCVTAHSLRDARGAGRRAETRIRPTVVE